MAVLSDNARAEVWADIMRRAIALGAGNWGGITKAQGREALNAIDDWLNTNAASLNSAIPQPQRSAMSTAQKAIMLMGAVARRYLDGA